MGKGGNASAAGPKPVGKGLKPDRQYTQIRGQVRLAPRRPSIEDAPTRFPRLGPAACAIQRINEDGDVDASTERVR
jgi:hypothetical protein